MQILVPGANGFVGQATCTALRQAGHAVLPAVRVPHGLAGEIVVGDMHAQTDWRAALAGVDAGIDAVVHLAARVHVMNDTAADPLAQYRSVNVAGTLQLAQQAHAAGVRRFVYVSSIKVNGEERATPYTEADTPAPEDAYARSKWEAEQGLHKIAAETGLEVVILRPPLVYGPGVGANFLALMRAIARGLPLPLGALDAQRGRRSMIFVGNLADAIACCVTHPVAAGKTFLLSDGEDIATPELARRIAAALGTQARLIPIPARWLKLLVRTAQNLPYGRKIQALARRLTEPLSVDSQAIRRTLGWTPPFTLDEGLRATAAWFRNRQ
jgi:nucleoside-diphosphate-sugar epimerase